MKEIARIHIAKVPYDIELGAKQELEAYIRSLEQYADDAELLQDIEIRITELLHARGVAQNGVIGGADVAAVRAQLGEPKDFASDDNGSKPEPATLEVGSGRALYRDIDHAVLGGVLSGVAAFFKIEALWVRLIFIVLLIASFGTAILLYLLLWAIVPPAKTAAEKLRLTGKPVNLSSIRELSEQGEPATDGPRRAETFQRVLLFVAGCFSLFAALAGTILTLIGVFVVGFRSSIADGYLPLTGGWAYWSIVGLFALSGLLFAALFAIGAYMAFTRKVPKKLGVSLATIVLTGLLTFGTGIAAVVYQSWAIRQDAHEALVETTVPLPAEFANVRNAVITIDGQAGLPWDSLTVPVEYTAGDTTKAQLWALPGDKPKITVDGTTAYISFEPNGQDVRYRFAQASLQIFGPQLDKLTVHAGHVTYTTEKQDTLAIEANGEASVSASGELTTVNGQTTGNSNVFLGNATVNHLVANTTDYSAIAAGTVQTLKATQPTVCPTTGMPASRISVQDVSAQSFTYNGEPRPVTSHETSCGTVTIGSPELPEEDREDRGWYSESTSRMLPGAARH